MALEWKPCGKCRKPIAFALHDRTRKPAPLEEDPNGRFTVVNGVYFLASPNVGPEWRYTNHFATCPGADGFRRRTSGDDTPANDDREVET